MSKPFSRPFGKLAVVGAGNMGGGIAQKLATEGFAVVLVDLDDAKVARGLASIQKSLEQGVERKILEGDQAKAILGRIEGTADWGRLADADLVVEAVFEDLAVKKEVFARLDATLRPESILGTNTSSFSVADIASATKRPERVVGLHYFYHPAKNPLVEVVPGERTSEEVFARAWSLQERIGKTPIASGDSYGFIVNRFLAPWLNESVRLLEESVADVPTIEEAAKKSFGVRMGPFELMNLTGIPVTLRAATTLGQAFGPMYAPAEALERQASSGAPWDIGGAPDASRFEAVAGRLLAVVFLAATELADEGVGSIEDTDIGARVGLRWPRGPFEMINRMGVAKAVDLVGEFAGRWDVAVPGMLSLQWRAGRPFESELVRSEVQEGIATLTIKRPDSMNALDETALEQLGRAFTDAAKNPAVRGIVIGGLGKAFVAGADIPFLVRNIEEKNLDRIAAFIRAGHDLLNSIDSCPKPVVARLHGLALGGGVELALACDRIIATPGASVAFPETGIGIYPGLGGTPRITRRIGLGLTKWLVYTGVTLSAEEAAAIGLVDRVVPHEALDEAVREAIAEGTGAPLRRDTVSDRHRALESFFSSNRVDAIREGKADTSAGDDLACAAECVGIKAPLALRLAERLIDEGAVVPLERGLAMELTHVVEIFGTRDAYEGLSTLGKKAPVFEGR